MRCSGLSAESGVNHQRLRKTADSRVHLFGSEGRASQRRGELPDCLPIHMACVRVVFGRLADSMIRAIGPAGTATAIAFVALNDRPYPRRSHVVDRAWRARFET